MPKLAGSVISVEFFTYPNQHPGLYYGASEGSYNLASVNAGNSDGMCVGLGGVNGQFFTDLTSAGQTLANTPPDHYEARHQRLLAKALAQPTQAAWESFAATDPSLFSYCYAAPVTQVSGWHDGVCFVDIFDAARRPAGNAKNVGMLYMAPPLDKNYTSAAAFLLAIETTAHNIIAAVAGYNALAPAQKLPAVESLRLTLYSSVNYNTLWSVPAGDIAHAIWRGLLAGVKAFPASGLLELQLPAAGAGQPPCFDALAADPALAGLAGAAPIPVPVPMPPLHHRPLAPHLGGRPVAEFEFGGERAFNEDAHEFDEFNSPPDVNDQAADDAVLQASDQETKAVIASIRASGQRWVQRLAPPPGNNIQLQNAGAVAAPPAGANAAGQQGNYGSISAIASNYEAVDSPFGWGPRREALDVADALEKAIQEIPDGKSAEVRKAVRGFGAAKRAMDAIVARLEKSAANPGPQENPAQIQADLAYVRAMRRQMGDAGKAYIDVARQEYTRRRAAENKKVIAAGIVGAVLAALGVAAGVWRTIADHFLAALDITLPFGPRRAGAAAAPQVVFDVVKGNDVAGLVASVTLSSPPTGWAVRADNLVTYAVPADPQDDSTVSYSMTLTNTHTIHGKLTASFAPDLVAVAADRTKAVALTARDGFAFVEKLDSPSPWSIDTTAAAPKVTFTPPAGFTAPYARKAFTDRAGSAVVRYVVILFPAQVLKSSPPNQLKTSLTAIPNFQAGDEVSVVLLNGTTPVTELKVTEGTWKVEDGEITFTPGALPAASATSVSVQYALRYGKSQSAAAAATVDYPAMPAGMTVDQTVYALSRTQPVVITVANAVLTGPLSDNFGSWSADAAQVTFTPAAALAKTGKLSVTRSYSVGTVTTNLTIVFVQPEDRSVADVSRVLGMASLPLPAKEMLPPGAHVWLWDGANRQTTITADGHTWSVAADRKTIQFRPAGTKFSEDKRLVEFVFSDEQNSQNNSAPGQAEVTFSTDTAAFPVKVDRPASGGKFEVDLADYCYAQAPKTITSVTLVGNDPARIKIETASKPTTVAFDPGGVTTAATYTANYYATDSSGQRSNTGGITCDFTGMPRRAMPAVANCLIAQSAAADQTRIANVLDGATAFHGVDAATVKLVGPADLGTGNTPVTVGLAADGKSMFVPFQGAWLVDPGGAIAFHADTNFNGAPSPAAFTVADKKGNVSPPALVMFDDSLAGLATLGKQAAAVTETQFWTDFRIHVSLLDPKLSGADFLKATQARAYAVGLAAKPTYDPVDLDDFDTAYQAWLDGGQAWDDKPGSKTHVGLVTICQQLVDQAMPAGSPELLKRYWRLQQMAHMAAQALPDGGAQ